MVIRKGLVGDLDSLRVLAKEIHDLHVSWRPDIFVESNEMMNIDRVKYLIEKDSLFVVIKDNNVVAYMVIAFKEKGHEGVRYKKYLVIDTICVKREYRRMGIGTKLLEFAEIIAKDNNCTDLYLSVNEENEAGINSYKSFGFTVKNISMSKRVD